MFRTSLILGTIAVALLAFIVIFEKGSLTTGELDARKGRVLERFVRTRVDRIEIQRKGVTTVLGRSPDPDNELDLGAWKLEAPLQAEADQDAVEALIGELEWMDARRSFERLEAADRTRFGLDKPRYRVAFHAGKQRDVLIVGGQSPKGDGTYIQLAARPDRAFVVGKDLIEALDQEPGHYHTRRLHGGITIYGSDRLSLRDAQPERVAVKRQSVWYLERPVQELAAFDALEASFGALDRLEASRFVSAQVARPAEYGLDAPTLQVSVVRKRYDEALQKPTDEPETLVFRVGSACRDHEGESYIRVGDSGPVHCAIDADWQAVVRSLDELREKRLVPFDPSQIDRMQVRQGARELVLTEKDDAWSYSLAVAGQASREGGASTEQVQAWFKALGASEVQRFEPQDQVSEGPAGLGKPLVSVTIHPVGERPDYTIALATPEFESVLAQRGGEKGLLRFDTSVLDLLEPMAARFRDPHLLSEPEGKLRTLRALRGDAPARQVERVQGTLRLAGDGAPAVDTTTLAEVVRLLSGLQAVRFAADAPAPAHGLEAPALQVSFEYAAEPAPVSHELRIGAATRDGSFARLDADPNVFVVDPALTRALEALWTGSTAAAPAGPADGDAAPPE